MPKKYHLHAKATPLDLEYVFKFKIVRGENCINCGKCSKVCIYEAHKRRKDDPRKMANPNTVVCRNCFRCIQECPRGALEKSLAIDFLNIGGSYWKPDMLISLWKQCRGRCSDRPSFSDRLFAACALHKCIPCCTFRN